MIRDNSITQQLFDLKWKFHYRSPYDNFDNNIFKVHSLTSVAGLVSFK